MKNLGNMMKQAQQMQQRMQEMQAQLDLVEMQGASGGGMVKVSVNGKGELKHITLDKQLMDPAETEVVGLAQKSVRSRAVRPSAWYRGIRSVSAGCDGAGLASGCAASPVSARSGHVKPLSVGCAVRPWSACPDHPKPSSADSDSGVLFFSQEKSSG